MTTRDDMLRALAGEPKAEEAIFWYCYAWHSGKKSDLYRILCESPHVPPPDRNVDRDPDLMRCWDILGEHFGPLMEVPYNKVFHKDVAEGDVLVAGSHFLCILNRWPCKVIRHPQQGFLCVTCKDGFHRLSPDPEGYVHGFRR